MIDLFQRLAALSWPEMTWQLMMRQMLYATIIFAVVALLVRRWSDRSPTLLYALWGLVVLRLVLPVGLAAPFGLATLLHDALPIERPSGVLSAPAAPATEEPVAMATIPQAAHRSRLANAGFGTWFAASFLYGARSMCRRRSLVRLARCSPALDSSVAHCLLERWRERYGIRRSIRLVSGDRGIGRKGVGPFTIGTLRPIVYVPMSIARLPQLLEATLAHELAHVRRLDDLRLCLQELVRAFWVLFPLVHVAVARMRQERERVCDGLATGPGCLSRRRYVAALKTILADGLVPSRAVPGLASPASGNFHRRNLSMRFHSLLTEPASSPLTAKLAYLAVLLLLMPMAPMIAPSPAAADPPIVAAVDVSPDAAVALPSMINPLPGEKVTSGFGLRRNPFGGERAQHTGIDLHSDSSSRVLAPADGVVEIATEVWAGHESWGTVVILDHGEGVQTFYAHLDSFAVKQGQSVRQGQTIGVPGATGESTGPHLHFEVHCDGKPIDPAAVVTDWR